MEEIRDVLDDIVKIADPELVVLFGQKWEATTGLLRDVDICVVCMTVDKNSLERVLYLSIDAEVSFDLVLYTPDEWETLVLDRQSFAHRIMEKGTVAYERPAH